MLKCSIHFTTYSHTHHIHTKTLITFRRAILEECGYKHRDTRFLFPHLSNNHINMGIPQLVVVVGNSLPKIAIINITKHSSGLEMSLLSATFVNNTSIPTKLFIF